MAHSEPYEINCDPPTAEEISKVVSSLKNRKSPGEDGIPPELIKTCLSTLLEPLHALFSAIWEQELLPSDWGISLLLPIPKKGDRTVCDNYRGISLIDVAAEVFAAILLERFSEVRDSRTRPNQNGFRRGRGCIDQIFNLRRILEHRQNSSSQQRHALWTLEPLLILSTENRFGRSSRPMGCPENS